MKTKKISEKTLGRWRKKKSRKNKTALETHSQKWEIQIKSVVKLNRPRCENQISGQQGYLSYKTSFKISSSSKYEEIMETIL